MRLENIIMMLIILLFLGVFIFVGVQHFQDSIRLQNLCENNDGSYQDYPRLCLLEEDGIIIEYKMLKFKDEYRLVRK